MIDFSDLVAPFLLVLVLAGMIWFARRICTEKDRERKAKEWREYSEEMAKKRREDREPFKSEN